mmetsp:Transcript_30286/g.34770  ORF Transcript_30286/g.34770 Transcript_30286/m.34770 type:complete len:1211 (+) Transcript_30286:140-3772(+)
MDRVLAMLILLAGLGCLVLCVLAFFAYAPILCSCLLSLIYTLYLFIAYEESGVHYAQEYENRFWTIFVLLVSTALFFANDSPIAIGRYSPTFGLVLILLSSFSMHVYDRHVHRTALSRAHTLRRSFSLASSMGDQQVTGEQQRSKINQCLKDIDQPLIASTINNIINRQFILKKEKEIITIFLDCNAVTLNYLICHLKLALLVYKIKDHGFGGQNRSKLLEIIAVERLPVLTAHSRVIVLAALQILKMRANPTAEHWVRNILLNTTGDDLSDVKTMTDQKGDYYCMIKLIYDDIKSETVRYDILKHIRTQGAMQLSRRQVGTRGPERRNLMAWRKILSDVDDTLLSSGGSYPSGIDKRYSKKVVYPGVLAFYRELDLGTTGPDDWPENTDGNLVFLSARPHVYKDMSEKSNFAKFERLRTVEGDGRRGMHTTPSLLAGDLASGKQYITTNTFGPLALKKFDNFKRYVSIYPEYHHIFVCDNGQGDVNAAEMMHDHFPREYKATYVHLVQERQQTYGYALKQWKDKEFLPCFFKTYPEAALHAATQNPPLIRIIGLRRVCSDAVKDFNAIPSQKWQSQKQKADRRVELNQSIWKANILLSETANIDTVNLIQAERLWEYGEKVKTPYGNGIIRGFDLEFDLYDVELNWKPLDKQVQEHIRSLEDKAISPKKGKEIEKRSSALLETVVEADEVTDDEQDDIIIAKTAGAAIITSSTDEVAGIKDSENSTSMNKGDINKIVPDNGNKIVVSNTIDSLSISPDNMNIDQRSINEVDNSFKVTAKINGRSISKFVPPSLPKINKRTAPLFSFWVAVPEPKVNDGEKCSTPYGPATIIEHHIDQKIIVVDMIGWTARAYLNEDDVEVTKMKEGFLASLFRRQSSITDPIPPNLEEFPYAKGRKVRTKYGEAEVIVPLSPPDTGSTDSDDISNMIICLSITSWTLANESHPKLYCTVKSCQTWKAKEGKVSSDGILSAFGTLVSNLNREIKGRLSTGNQKSKEEELITPKFKQYYRDSAAVSTSFGDGRIIGFRKIDGFYSVSLSNWKCTAWLKEVDICYQIARGCKEGYPVLTNLGVSGILESVQPTTGIHIVSAPSARMILYLQPEAISRELKAAVGEVVLTAYGEGNVERYDCKNDTYVIKLNRWNARIYAKAEAFDRLRDSMRDRESFGMDWLLRFFFSSPDSKKESTRSRSNSVVSATTSIRSHQSGKTTGF